MIKKLFTSLKKYTQEDLLAELLKPTFNEESVNKIFKNELDINWKNEKEETYLHLCAKKNRTQSILWLIQNGADVESQTKDKLTPIFYAVESNAKESLKLLIKNKANVDHQNIYDRTVLQESVITNQKNLIDILLNASENINNVDKHGHNVIFDAIANGNKELVLKIANNKNINLNQVDESGKTILHQKEVIKDENMAIALMEKGADPTIKDFEGKDFLFHAAANGIESEKIFDKAISMNCDINAKNNKNQTILMETLLVFVELTNKEKARRASLFSMLKKLIAVGVKINSEDNENETALFIAVRNKDIDSMTLLLSEHEIDVNHKNKNGDTVLTIAALDGIDNLDLILLLLKSGANPNIKDAQNQTVIEKLINTVLYYHNDINNDEAHNEQGKYMLVLKEILQNSNVDLLKLNSKGKPLFFDTIFYQNEYLFKLLKDYGIDINAKDTEGSNAIHNLMEYSNKKKSFSKKSFVTIFKRLVSLGIDLNGKDNKGSTVMHKAILGESDEILKTLLESKQTDMNAVDNKGRSLVHSCVWKDNVKYFKMVHAYDKDVLNKPDKFGVLPINYAAFMGYNDIVTKMIESGSYINNTNAKNDVIVDYLKRFSKNLSTLIKDADGKLNKKNIELLVTNMKKEFGIS